MKANKKKKSATALSNFVWENKHGNTGTSLEWKNKLLRTRVKKVHAISNREIPHPLLKT